MLRLPTIIGSTKARNTLSKILNDVERGATFIIKGPKGKEALVISVSAFRRLQESYLDMVGQLETIRLLEDEGRAKKIERASKEASESIKLHKLSEVEETFVEVEEAKPKDEEEFPETEEAQEESETPTAVIDRSVLDSGLLDLPVEVQNGIMRQIRMIVQEPDHLGVPHPGTPDLRSFHGTGYRITWRVKQQDGKKMVEIVDVRANKTPARDEKELVVSRPALEELQDLPAENQQQVVQRLTHV